MYTYVTLLSTDNYIYGVLGLYYSIKKVKSKYSLLVLVTENVKNINILEQYQIPYIYIPTVINRVNQLYDNSTINKLYYYNLTQYEKICFLDADVILLNNIDTYFDNETPCGYQPPNKQIWGGCIFLSPNKEIYNTIVWNDLSNDEDFLNKNIVLKTFLPITLLSNLLYHDMNRQKYWEKYSLYNLQDIQSYIDNLI